MRWCKVFGTCSSLYGFVAGAKIHIFRKTTMTSKMLQFDFLIAAKLIHLVPDVVFEGLDVLFVGAAVDEVENLFSIKATP